MAAASLLTCAAECIGSGYILWAYSSLLGGCRYNERIDAEALQTRDLVLNQGRTRRVTRPVTRFVPPQIDSGAHKGNKAHRKGYDGAFDKKKKKKHKKRRSPWGSDDGKVRRERKLRRRVKKLLLAGKLDVDR